MNTHRDRTGTADADDCELEPTTIEADAAPTAPNDDVLGRLRERFGVGRI